VSQIITPTIVSKECRFAIYVPPPNYGEPDMHLVKEIRHMSDGTTVPHVALIKDFKRPFWTSKKGQREYKQKKEWEIIDYLVEGASTQSTLVDNIAKAMQMPWYKGNLRGLCTSPYIYGADILSTAIIKKTYQEKYQITPTKYSMAVFDTETDVLNGTGDVIMATLTYKGVVFTAVVKSFLEGIVDVHSRVEVMMDKYLGEYVVKRNLKSELVIVDTAFDACKACLDVAHRLKPDWLAIWNLDFDINKIIQACDKVGADPAWIMSDPSVPRQYQYFKYVKGPNQKVTASGLTTPIKPAAQWHTVYCPASFYVIDAMCAFKHIRVGQPEMQSYSLDYILNSQLGIRKLKFKEADQYTGLKWHEYMQTYHKLEYIIYNRFDCISIEELDEKTSDLSLTLPLFSGFSDFANFKSQPRRTVDNLHYYCLSKGMVIGTTGKETAIEMDEDTVGLDGWIVTLPAALVADNGLQIIEEYPEMKTNIRGHVGDLDVTAAYPTNECVFNVSKETTKKEIISIEGIDLYTQKMQGINLSAGHTNAVEWCTTVYKFPTLDVLLEDFISKTTA